MSDYRKPTVAYLAPGLSGTMRAEFPGPHGPRVEPKGDPGYAPAIVRRAPAPYDPHNPDDHAVEPETGKEMIDGRVMRVLPSESPHADRQFDIAYVLHDNIAPGYIGSTELLTRVDQDNNFATDACIRRRGEDADGNRHLEEISFEVKYTQSEASLKKRARDLIRRGVRRVFAIYVARDESGGDPATRDGRVKAGGGKASAVLAGPVKEWSVKDDDWIVLDNDSTIEDRCLRHPVKVRAFIDAAEASRAVARALVAQQHPVIVEARNQSYDQGKSDGYDKGKSDGYDQGLRQGIRALCRGFEIEFSAERTAELEALDRDGLQALMDHLQKSRAWRE